jgi:hypothetical protein
LHPGRDDTEIVAERAAGVLVEVVEHSADHRRGLRARALPDRCGKPLLPVQLVARAMCLGDAVGVEQQPGAGVELGASGVTGK